MQSIVNTSACSKLGSNLSPFRRFRVGTSWDKHLPLLPCCRRFWKRVSTINRSSARVSTLSLISHCGHAALLHVCGIEPGPNPFVSRVAPFSVKQKGQGYSLDPAAGNPRDPEYSAQFPFTNDNQPASRDRTHRGKLVHCRRPSNSSCHAEQWGKNQHTWLSDSSESCYIGGRACATPDIRSGRIQISSPPLISA